MIESKGFWIWKRSETITAEIPSVIYKTTALCKQGHHRSE